MPQLVDTSGGIGLNPSKVILVHLARLATRVPTEATHIERFIDGRLDDLLETVLEVAAETGGPIAEILLEQLRRKGQSAHAFQIYECVPFQSELAHCRYWALRHLIAHAKSSGVDDELLDAILSDLSYELEEAGHLEAALDYTEQRVARHSKRLDEVDLAFAAERAASLAYELGRPQRAYEYATTAVTLLAHSKKTEYLETLTVSRDTLATICDSLGLTSEARQQRELAVVNANRLKDTDEGQSTIDRTDRSYILSRLFLGMNKPRQALPQIIESVDTERELYLANPANHAAGLNCTLDELGRVLICLGEFTDAQTALAEAYELAHSELATGTKGARGDLVQTLALLAYCATTLKNPAGAYRYLHEGAGLLDALPPGHRSGISATLLLSALNGLTLDNANSTAVLRRRFLDNLAQASTASVFYVPLLSFPNRLLSIRDILISQAQKDN